MNVIYLKEHLSKRFSQFLEYPSLEAATGGIGFEHLFKLSVGSLLMLTLNNGLNLLGCLLSCMRICGIHGFCFLLL
jgi:hypothetical protein